MANPFDQFDDGATAVMDAPPSAAGNPFDAFDDAPTEPNPFDQFDAEPASAPTSIESQQTPLETGIRAFAQAPGQTALSAYAGAARGMDTLAETLGQKLPAPLGAIYKGAINAATFVPSYLGGIAKDAADRSEDVYAPDRARNPKAATVGGAIGQALPMAASAVVAGPAGPMALGAGLGMDQGMDQAAEMGITDPARKLAMGAAYAGTESLIEAAGGIGSRAFTDPLKRGAREMIKAGIKTVGSETLEEPATGIIQDAIAQGFAPASYDTTELRPFLPTRSGFPVPNDAYFTRRAYEALGGAAGGVAGAGVQALANRAASAPVEAPAPTADPLAAFAATMQETVEQPVPGSRFPVADVEAGMVDEPVMEGDILRDFNIQPDVAPRVAQAERDGAAWDAEQSARQAAYDTQFPRLVFDDEQPTAQPGTGNPEPRTSSIASVTDTSAQPGPVPVSEVSNGPESAPRDKTATDAIGAGSNPATGATQTVPGSQFPVPSSEQPGTVNPEPGTQAYSGPQFGSAAPISTTRQTPVIPDAPWGARDVLDFINDNTIAVPGAILDVINQKKKAKLAPQSTGDFNWLEKYDVPKAWRKYFFSESADSTSNINEVAQDAYDEGLISDPTPDALMEGVLNSIDARESYTRAVDAREKQLAEEEKALIAREKAEAKRQQSWADEVINGSMETPFIGIDPKLMAAYTVKGAQLIKEGFTTFSKWSREMISRFGEKVREYLQGVWQAARKTSQRGSIGGDPLDNRATSERMASESGAAQNANEPSPGGLSEKGVKLWGEVQSLAVKHGIDLNPQFGNDASRARARLLEAAKIRRGETRVKPAAIEYFAQGQEKLAASDLVLLKKELQTKLVREGKKSAPQAFRVLGKVTKTPWGSRYYHFDYKGQWWYVRVADHANTADRTGIDDNVQGRHYTTSGMGFPHRLNIVLDEAAKSDAVALDYAKKAVLKALEDHQLQPDESGSYHAPVLRGTDGNVKFADSDGFAEELSESRQEKNQPRAESGSDMPGRGPTNLATSKTGEPIPPQTPPSVNPNLNPTGAEGRAQGFKNLDTSGTTAGFLNTDIINEGANLIARGVRDFAVWSKAMVQKFGAAIRDYLQGVWQAAMQTSEQGFIGTGNREPGTATPNEIKLTHEAEAARMETQGQEALPTGGQFTVEGVTAEAAERVRNGEAPALLRSLETDPRILTPLEHYMLMNYAGALESAIEQNSATLADPSTTPEARTRAAAEKSIATEERIKIAVVAQIAGSKAGAALGARSRGIARAAIPSLAEMVADITLIQDPTGKTPLPPEERAVIEKTHAKMVEAEQALETQREEGKGGARETFNTELQKLLDEAREEIKAQQAEIERQKGVVEEAMKPRPRAITLAKNVRAKLKTAADEARERMKARGFQFSANPVFDPQFIADAAIIMADNLADGINGAIVLVREFGDAIKPFMNQIRDKAEILIRDSKKKTTTDDVLAKGRKHAAANDGKPPRSLARQLALAHIVDHIERGDKTLSAAKIADLVRADLEEFQPGITTREARDLISGYGQATFPSKDEARAELRNLAAQMQKLTQLEALRNKERLLKSGPQRDKPSAELRELQKQVEALKKDLGYEARSKEDELKSARDRIKNFLENQIEELQRVLDGKARPANPREAIVYDAELTALKDLRGSMRDLVAEMPEHKLASEERRNRAALKSAQKSEAEWNRRAKAMQWTRPGKPPKTFTDEVNAAKAKAKEARANFEALKKAADPRNDPEAKALRDFKRRTQKSIDDINTKIRTGAFDPPKKTPRQIKHDEESEKLRHELAMKKREWIDLKLQHRMATMGWGGKGLELVRKLYHLIRSLKAGGEFSGVLNQGMIPMVSHPILTFGSIPKMFKAFVSAQNETTIMDQIWARGNSINGRYKKHRLAINDHMDYSTLQAEGNYRSAWGNKIPFFAGTGRAYTTLLNQMRADLFDHLVSKLEAHKARRNETVTDRELDALAEEVNDSTGHGKLPFGLNNGNAKDLLGAFIFSPSFVMSRARYLAATSLWGGTKDSRAIIATERVRAMAGFAALYALALALQGDDDDKLNLTEPRDSTWMKPKIGNTYLDLLAGLQQIAVLFSRLATGSTVKDGKETDLTDPNSRSDRGDLLMKFAKTKRSPAITMADEMFLSQKDYFGKPLSRGQAALNAITPITAGSIKDLLDNEPLERAIPLSAGAVFGLRTDSRAPTR